MTAGDTLKYIFFPPSLIKDAFEGDIGKNNKKIAAKQAAQALEPVKSPLLKKEELKPGQKINAIATTPYGLLNAPNTASSRLLGG